MSFTSVSVRAQAARATWASVCAVLFVAMAAQAASSKQENPGKALPVVSTVPADEAVKVRPDTAVSLQLDTQSQEYRAFRQQLESGRFAIQVEGGASTQLFVGEPGSEEGQATFDAQTGTVSTPALSLSRYTTYTVTLAVKAAYEALLHGQPLPGNDAYSFAFVTGSALHEPTRYSLLPVGTLEPRVTETMKLSLSAFDDYGELAWGSTVSVRVSEDGTRLASSARASPSQLVLSEGGPVTVDISDREAEGVQVTLEATGAWPENAWSQTLSLRFRPGPAASFTEVQHQPGVTAETSFNVCARVLDAHGNGVEDGTEVSLSVSPGTSKATGRTVSGRFCAALVAPYGKGTLLVSLSSGTATHTASMQLYAPPATFMSVSVSPPSGYVPADGSSAAFFRAELRDSKMRLVLDGATVSWATNLGTLSNSFTSTKNGWTSVTLRSTTPGTAQVLVRTGELSWVAGMVFTPVVTKVAYISNISYSQPCWSGAGYTSYPDFMYAFRAKQGCEVVVHGTARDENGNIVRNAFVRVGLRVDWGGWTTNTATTDSAGRFSIPVVVSSSSGSNVSRVYENGAFTYHHWDWAYLYFISDEGLIDPWDQQIYTLASTNPWY